MGNSSSNSKSPFEDMKQELIKQMNESQQENVVKLTEYSRKMNEAQRIAFRRDRVQWLAFLYGIAGTILIYEIITKRRIPWRTVGLGVVSVTAFLYSFDYAYLNKTNRINSMRDEIVHNSSFWFYPLYPKKQKDNDEKS